MERISKILRCTCAQAFQDERYGRQMRVHNPCKEGWRCTGCGNIKPER